MNLVAFTIAVIVGLMLAEQQVSRRHERLLQADGAVQPPGDVFRALAWSYPASFIVMGLEGAWRASLPVASGSGPAWAASGALLFLGSKALKYWAIRALGYRWSFRVYALPGRPLVTSGPYQYLDHPNYVAVLGELAGTALLVHAWVTGPIVFVLFGAVLWRRWRFEDRVLASVGAKHVVPGSVD